MNIQFSLALILLLAAHQALGRTDDVFGTWTSLTLQGDFSFISPEAQDFRWMFIDQARTRGDRDLRDPNDNGLRFSENLIWVQGGYNLSEHASIWLGYTHDWIRPLNGDNFQESRPHEDFLWVKPFGALSVTLRSRLEERIALNGGAVGVRIRQFAMLKHPLPYFERLSWYAGDEVLAYLTENDFGPEGFSENRAFGGLMAQLSPYTGLMLGYMGQFINNEGSNNLFTHNLQFDINYKF
ncbi:DUF2490 domain-containing protein [Nitrococcus mobilis]